MGTQDFFKFPYRRHTFLSVTSGNGTGRRSRKVFGKKQSWYLKTENLDLDSRSAVLRDRLSVQVGPRQKQRIHRPEGGT